MNPIEQEVREMLRTKVAQAPVREEPPPVVLRRTRTLRAINGIGATAAAAAVVLGIVFGAQLLGDRPTPTPPIAPGAAQPVPWLPLAASPNDTDVLDLKPSVGKPCAAGDVSFEVIDGFGFSFLPTRSDVSCVIDPHAAGFSVSVLSADARVPVTVVVAESTPVLMLDGARRPAAESVFTFSWPNYCGPRPERFNFSLLIPPGIFPEFNAESDVSLPPCIDPLAASTLTVQGVGPRGAGSIALPLVGEPAVANLGVAIAAPSTIARGETLEYTVRLNNAQDEDVRLDPCPDYAEGLQQGDVDALLGQYRLNCEGVKGATIPAGGSVEFEMEMKVLMDQAPGRWTLFWIFEPFRQLPATTVIEVL